MKAASAAGPSQRTARRKAWRDGIGGRVNRAQPLAYSSWRRSQMPFSLRPRGARSSH
jgi:hypothetical protein